jgi:ABC-2 type transport system permease protein
MIASLRRIRAIAGTTLIELARLRVFYVLVLFALVLIVSSTFLARISFQQELQVTKDISLGAINFFLSLLAIVATAQLLPRDIEDRVVYSVLAKPVPRFEYILGKFLGVLGLLALSLVAMSVLCLVVLHVREQSALQEANRQVTQLAPDQLSSTLRSIHMAGINRDLIAALALVLAKSAILAAATLCISAFATSNIFTITAMAMVYLIGHLESIAREYWMEHAAGWVARTFLAVVAFIFPDLQAFNISDQVIGGIPIPAHLIVQLLGLTTFYVFSYILVATAIFYQREL